MSCYIARRWRAAVIHGSIPEREFEFSGFLPDDIRSVDDLIGLLPVFDSITLDEELPRVSREVFKEGEPGWVRITSEFVTLPIEIVRNSGIAGLKTNDFILYIRERCFQELKFLCDFVIGEGRIGRIHGHPGTGKSITALYFAAHMAANRGWNVLWVHVKHGAFICLHMKPDRSTYRKINTDRVELGNYINNFHLLVNIPVTGHLILIDGLRGQDSQLEDLVEGWCHRDRQNRRLVWLSSDGVDNDENDCDASDADRATFHQWSWKLEEYRAAMENPEFRSNVSDVLIHDNLDTKYFFAGGCARYMFGYSIADVKERICKAVRTQMKSVRAGATRAHFDLGSVHSLFSYFGGHTYEIVSKYAEEELVRRCGSDELICLARHSMIQRIPSTIGLLFESYVKQRASQENQMEIIHYDLKGNGNPTRWKINGVEDFAPNTLTKDNCPLDTLMSPLSDQELTIDALILSEEMVDEVMKRVVRFIQITISEKHRADLAVLEKHMVNLEADVAEFYFVLPPEPRSRIAKFTVSPLLNKNAMVSYNWPENSQEIQNEVIQVVTFPGWNV